MVLNDNENKLTEQQKEELRIRLDLLDTIHEAARVVATEADNAERVLSARK
jgi:hypothetical protein